MPQIVPDVEVTIRAEKRYDAKSIPVQESKYEAKACDPWCFY